MFTGLIEEVGRVEKITQKDGQRRLTVSASRLVKTRDGVQKVFLP